MYSEKELKSAAQVARRHNNKAARKLPLFAAAGILDQVVTPATVALVLQKRTQAQQATRACWTLHQQRVLAHIARYKAALAEMAGAAAVAAVETQLATSSRPSGLEYTADYWNRAIAQRTGLTPLEVFNRYKEET